MVIEKIREWEKRFKETSVNCTYSRVGRLCTCFDDHSFSTGGEERHVRVEILKFVNLLKTKGGRQRQKQSILRERSKRQRDRQMEKETPTRRYREKVR